MARSNLAERVHRLAGGANRRRPGRGFGGHAHRQGHGGGKAGKQHRELYLRRRGQCTADDHFVCRMKQGTLRGVFTHFYRAAGDRNWQKLGTYADGRRGQQHATRWRWTRIVNAAYVLKQARWPGRAVPHRTGWLAEDRTGIRVEGSGCIRCGERGPRRSRDRRHLQHRPPARGVFRSGVQGHCHADLARAAETADDRLRRAPAPTSRRCWSSPAATWTRAISTCSTARRRPCSRPSTSGRTSRAARCHAAPAHHLPRRRWHEDSRLPHAAAGRHRSQGTARHRDAAWRPVGAR